MLAALQLTSRQPSVLPLLVYANIDDEHHVHNAIAEACYFANGQHHTLRISTREHPEIRSVEPRAAPDGHIDFGNLLEPPPSAAEGLQ